MFFLTVCKETNKCLYVKGFFPNLTGENPYFVLMPVCGAFRCAVFVCIVVALRVFTGLFCMDV